MRELIRRWLDPHDIARGRITGLLGLLWLSGGAVTVGSVPFGPFGDGSPAGVLAVGAFAVLLGAALLTQRTRRLPAWLYVSLALLGSVSISLILVLAGDQGRGAATILYVFITTFVFIGFRRWAVQLVGASAMMHAAVLWWLEIHGAFGRWIITWGVASVTGLIAGQVVAATRQALDEQDRLVDQLRDADTTKTAFVHALGHELARPVTVISGLADTILRRPDLDEEERDELLERVATRAEGLRAMLESLLRFSEVTEGRVPLTIAQVELTQVIDRAIELAEFDRDRLRTHGVEGHVAVDGAKLAHAIANLLSNAAKYAPADTSVDLRVERRQEDVVIGVEDRGPGVPEADRRRIFEPFERTEPDDAVTGSGLGLSIVRQFARIHGGEAWVEPRPGGGARFRISIARNPGSAPATSGRDSSPHRP